MLYMKVFETQYYLIIPSHFFSLRYILFLRDNVATGVDAVNYEREN